MSVVQFIFYSYFVVLNKIQLSATKEDMRSLTFKGPRVTWHRPLTVNELLDLKMKHPSAKLIGGNTEIGNISAFLFFFALQNTRDALIMLLPNDYLKVCCFWGGRHKWDYIILKN